MANTESNAKVKVAVVGGGLVGALQACFLGKRGFQVDLYEKRPDIRTQQTVKGRSINLALSERGRAALRHIGLEQSVLKQGVPMFGRMIHDKDNTLREIPYGQDSSKHYNLSVDRRQLNEILLNEAETYSNVEVFFEYKFKGIDSSMEVLTFESPSGEVQSTRYSAVFSCDGAYSGLRRCIMRCELLDYSQSYIPHRYLELRMPPTADGKHQMHSNSLHIWAREQFMMIGLPNQDGTYTMTLFMPHYTFDKIRTRDNLMAFFRENFADAIPLLGEKEIETVLDHEEQPLFMIKCNPHHAKGKVVLMGDAAHAMVPFYGQGMNCGFEDCLVMEAALNKHHNNFAAAFAEYSDNRVADAHAICDLAMYNYIEMRSKVNSNMFLLRKKVDNFLFRVFPNSWVPLYNMVSFSRIPYNRCIQDRAWQDRILTRSLLLTGGFTVGLASLVAFKAVGECEMSVDLWSSVAARVSQMLGL